MKLLAFEMRCLGLESISRLVFSSRPKGVSGLDRLRAAVDILTEEQSLFVPCGFLPVIISLQSKDNVGKEGLLHKVHASTGLGHRFGSTSRPPSDVRP